MLDTKSTSQAVAESGTALLRSLFERAANGEGTIVVADDLPELMAILNLHDHRDSHVKRAIKSLHYGGAIDCGHPKLEEFKNTPVSGQRGYKIKLLIKA